MVENSGTIQELERLASDVLATLAKIKKLIKQERAHELEAYYSLGEQQTRQFLRMMVKTWKNLNKIQPPPTVVLRKSDMKQPPEGPTCSTGG